MIDAKTCPKKTLIDGELVTCGGKFTLYEHEEVCGKCGEPKSLSTPYVRKFESPSSDKFKFPAYA